MRHWGVEVQLFDRYYCLSTSFSRTPESSAVSFFSPWRSFLGTALCRDWTWSDPPGVGFEGIFYLAPLSGVSLTPYSTSACSNGINQICVSPALLPSPLSITNCRVIVQHLFMHSFLIWYLLSSFYQSLLDLMEALKNKTQYLLPKNTTLETKRKFLQIK